MAEITPPQPRNSWLPSLAGGIIGLGGSVISTLLGNKANKDMADYQYQKDLDMWNRTNAYNSPEQQMQRLKAAGLNPNLVYGTGATANTAPAVMPRYQAPHMETVHDAAPMVMNTISNYMDLKAKQAQISNMEQQTQNLKLDAIIKSASADYAPQFSKYNAELLSERIRNLVSSSNRNDIMNLLTKAQTSSEQWKLKNLYPTENTLKGQQTINLKSVLEQIAADVENKKQTTTILKNRSTFGADAPVNTQSIINAFLKFILR